MGFMMNYSLWRFRLLKEIKFYQFICFVLLVEEDLTWFLYSKFDCLKLLRTIFRRRDKGNPMRNKKKTPNNKTLSIKKAVRWGNCKVFAKKILPPDKKINYKCQECGDFFCKTLYQPCQGARGLIFV